MVTGQETAEMNTWTELPPDGPMGPLEVAEFMDVKRATVQQWLFRRVLPDRDYTVSGFPAWKKDTIVQWGINTGRLDANDPRAK